MEYWDYLSNEYSDLLFENIDFLFINSEYYPHYNPIEEIINVYNILIEKEFIYLKDWLTEEVKEKVKVLIGMVL